MKIQCDKCNTLSSNITICNYIIVKIKVSINNMYPYANSVDFKRLGGNLCQEAVSGETASIKSGFCVGVKSAEEI